MKIKIVTETLTDNSKVHDVIIISEIGNVVRLPCIDAACARVLADMLYDAVNDFTTESATLI